MKIIHITDTYNPFVGNPPNNIVQELKKRGHDVSIYTSALDITKKQYDSSCPIKTIGFKRFKLLRKAIYPGLIVRLLSQKNPDIIHSWVMGFFSTLVSGYLKPIRGYPLIVTSDFDAAEPKPTLWKKPYVYFYRKLPLKFADKILTFTKTEKNELVKRFGFDDKKIEISPIGIDFKQFSSKPKENLRKKLKLEGKFIILNVCFLSPKKNLELALRTISKLGDKRIVFIHVGGVSDGVYKQKLDEMIKSLGLKENVVFIGKVSRQKLYEFYKICDVFLNVGFKESYCIPILEAMAAGKPVVTTKVGIVYDAIENGKNGFIVKNESDIADRIKVLMENKNLRLKTGKNAQKTAKEYDWKIIINRLEKIYEKVAKVC